MNMYFVMDIDMEMDMVMNMEMNMGMDMEMNISRCFGLMFNKSISLTGGLSCLLGIIVITINQFISKARSHDYLILPML